MSRKEGQMRPDLKEWIRDIPDFPSQGILFRDITPALLAPDVFSSICALSADRYRDRGIKKIAAIESRGFIFGAVLARELEAGLIPLRKQGKLPYETISEEYELEYGTACLEIHTDAINSGEKVLIVDDLLATGGTAGAACRLVERLGGEIEELLFIIELSALRGGEKLQGRPFYSLVSF